MTYEVCIAIVLTALCAILAALAIGIGVLAVWGYSGIKEVRNSIEKDVSQKADAALVAKLSEYPEAESIISLFNRFKEQSEFMEQLRNQMTGTESNNVAQASNTEHNGVEDQASGSIADDYPNGQEGGTNAGI